MDLTASLRARAEERGAEFFGVADLAPARAEIERQGGPEVAAWPRAVAVGMALPGAIVDQLPRRAERAAAIDYRHHAYDVVNSRLDLLASELASLLQRAGHRVRPVPASRRVDDERLCGVFSHKLAAHLAGLGWIGRSCLLVTPERGPRVRWATVLTDAPLPTTGSAREPACGDCRECVEICPVEAFTGRPFSPDEPREARYDARACSDYFARLRAADPETAVCGLCLYACPHGRAP